VTGALDFDASATGKKLMPRAKYPKSGKNVFIGLSED
jgi:hypothetical protein